MNIEFTHKYHNINNEFEFLIYVIGIFLKVFFAQGKVI